MYTRKYFMQYIMQRCKRSSLRGLFDTVLTT
jgi:hypothetical protein